MSTSAQTDALPPGDPGPRDGGPTGTGASPGRRASRAALLGAGALAWRWGRKGDRD